MLMVKNYWGVEMILMLITSACDSEESQRFFGELYNQYRPIMFSVASKYISDYDSIEDIIHEVMIKLIEKESLLTTFDGCTLRTYIVYTIRNKSISFLRSRTREKGKFMQLDEDLLETTNIVDNGPLPEDIVFMNEMKVEFVKMWDSLPSDVKELLAGKYILQMSNSELAKEFGCSPDSIRMKLTRARRLALKKIKDGGFNFEPT